MLIVGSRQQMRPTTSQRKVDWTHPLARDMTLSLVGRTVEGPWCPPTRITTLGTLTPALTPRGEGLYGPAQSNTPATFDGITQDQMLRSDRATSLTIAFWLKYTNMAVNGVVLAFGGVSLFLRFASGGDLTLQWALQGGGIWDTRAGLVPTANEYACFMIAMAPGQSVWYKNGEHFATIAVGSSVAIASNAGGLSLLSGVLGGINQLNIWRRQLNSKEAEAYYRDSLQFYKQRYRSVPDAASAAGAPSITALSAISITATSAQPRISYS